MIKPFLSLSITLIILFCVGCTQKLNFDGNNTGVFLERSDIINLPFKLSEQGLIIVTAHIDDGPPISMIIDTGATRSAIYDHVEQRLGLQKSDKTIQVHGMVQSGSRPKQTLPYIKLGHHKIDNFTVAVLQKFNEESDNSIKLDGLIGLDILYNFYIFFDHQNKILSLIPPQYSPPELPPSWPRVSLKSNPYLEDGLPLKYFDVRISGQIIPALLDIGSEFNLVNWPAIRHPRIWTTRRRLKEEWEISGAIGKFDPKVKVKLKDFRSGQKFWDTQNFLILSLESLDVLGVNDQPFMIAGVDMIAGGTFWLDFKAEQIAFKPLEDSWADIKKCDDLLICQNGY